jgi:peptidylprolyl isomerase
MIRRTAMRALLAVTVVTSLAACGGSEEPASTAATSAEAPAATSAEVSADLTEAPAVPGSDAPPPTELVTSDVVVGDGAEAVEGSTVALKYVGAFYETGEEFDSSWSSGADETFEVTLGEGRVIPGFEQAVYGMQVGGRRVVTIPSELGYGPQGSGPIPPDATLVFVLDLVSVG